MLLRLYSRPEPGALSRLANESSPSALILTPAASWSWPSIKTNFLTDSPPPSTTLSNVKLSRRILLRSLGSVWDQALLVEREAKVVDLKLITVIRRRRLLEAELELYSYNNTIIHCIWEITVFHRYLSKRFMTRAANTPNTREHGVGEILGDNLRPDCTILFLL